LSCYVRLMRKEDVAQVAKLDREVFPTQWPPTDYHHELQNRLAHYIVACEARETVETHQPSNEYIVGFAGIWIMVDEAHIINIAVQEDHRRQGIGELLLISIIDLATELNASIVTLEVRTSNTAAQSLYRKYGFSQVGIRKGYYTDNREDAIIMSTEKITSTPFQTQLNHLKHAHSGKWGIPLYQIVR